MALPIELNPGGINRKDGKGICSVRLNSIDNWQAPDVAEDFVDIIPFPLNEEVSKTEATARFAGLLGFFTISVRASTMDMETWDGG
jgi:hypothetical protein